MPLATHLTPNLIHLRASAATWREAVQLAGEMLERDGATAPEYTAEMLASIEENGPYVVLAPGFALAHSRPSPHVKRTAIAWVSLAWPVPFGDVNQTEVRTVVAAAAADHDMQLNLVSDLSELIGDSETLQRAINATHVDELRGILGHGFYVPALEVEIGA